MGSERAVRDRRATHEPLSTRSNPVLSVGEFVALSNARRSPEPDAIAVVTAASRGIGSAVSVELARRGHRVLAAMCDVASAGPVLEAAGDSAELIEVAQLDVTDPGDFTFPEATAVLVNNAGGMEHDVPFEATPVDEWRRIFELNVFSTVELTRRVVPVMRARGGGVICTSPPQPRSFLPRGSLRTGPPRPR
jgi:NAD(P)-dependent dehydrogenase (short-subunit alcohol dehydrogenase family)